MTMAMANSDTIDAQLLDLMLRAGSRWILWLLLGLSLAAVAVMVERLWFFVQEWRPRLELDCSIENVRAADGWVGRRHDQFKLDEPARRSWGLDRSLAQAR